MTTTTERPDVTETWLTIKEAAKFLSARRGGLSDAVITGEIPSVRFRGTYYLDPAIVRGLVGRDFELPEMPCAPWCADHRGDRRYGYCQTAMTPVTEDRDLQVRMFADHAGEEPSIELIGVEQAITYFLNEDDADRLITALQVLRGIPGGAK